MADALHVRYRPTSFADVIGNKAEVQAFKEAIELKENHTYLLTGPSGVGKTTLARLAAKKLGCTPSGLSEIDGATYTGIDEMRAVKELTRYKPFGSNVRVIIVDECHSLSQKAWESLLKAIEEPPSFVYWFFCTTQPEKVPATIKTRSYHLTLQLISLEGVKLVLERVLDKEEIELPTGVLDLIALQANGSPRQALVYLTKVETAKSYKDAAAMLKAVVEGDAPIALCRFLVSADKRSWHKAVVILKKLQEENPESIRLLVCNYVAKALENTTSERQAGFLLEVLDAFSLSYNRSENFAPLYLSVGRIVFRGEQ